MVGLAAARLRGRTGGRPTVVDEGLLRAARDMLPNPDASVTSIAKLLGVSPGTDLLCAFLRLPYDPHPGDLPENATPDQTRDHTAALQAYRSLREVRHTVIRIIGTHLRNDAEVCWQGHDLDFTSVTFDRGGLSKAVFTTGVTSFSGREVLRRHGQPRERDDGHTYAELGRT